MATRRKSIYDLTDQAGRLRTSSRLNAAREATITNAIDRYYTNISRTKSYQKTLRGFLNSDSPDSSRVYKALSRKYSSNTYRGMSQG